MTAPEPATPGQAAYGPYRVGDQVWVEGRIVGVNNSDDDWINVEAFGAVFTIEEPASCPHLAIAAAAPAAPDGLRDRLKALLGSVQKSADATRPSKKTQLEDEFAISLRTLLEEFG